MSETPANAGAKAYAKKGLDAYYRQLQKRKHRLVLWAILVSSFWTWHWKSYIAHNVDSLPDLASDYLFLRHKFGRFVGNMIFCSWNFFISRRGIHVSGREMHVSRLEIHISRPEIKKQQGKKEKPCEKEKTTHGTCPREFDCHIGGRTLWRSWGKVIDLLLKFPTPDFTTKSRCIEPWIADKQKDSATCQIYVTKVSHLFKSPLYN